MGQLVEAGLEAADEIGGAAAVVVEHVDLDGGGGQQQLFLYFSSFRYSRVLHLANVDLR